MRNTLLTALLLVLVLVAGVLFGRYTTSDSTAGASAASSAERQILYWVAPMDPNFRRDAPGKSPMGMDLVPVYADEAGSRPGVVSIDPAIASNLGVRTATAERSSLPRIVETMTHVAYDETTLKHVHTRVEGWIETLDVSAAGDPVRQGDLLFELYSPTLVNAQQEFLSALRSGNATLRGASRDRLAALGMTGADIAELERDRKVKQRVRFVAETDGVVAMLGVRNGMFVTPETDALSIAALDSVWVFAEVLERQATWVAAGQLAELRFEALPGERFETQVEYVYPELDPISRTLRLRLRVENPGRALRPNMLGRARIAGRETWPIVHVPREAVIRGGRGSRVVVALGDGRYESRRVLAGIESGDRLAVRRGLAEGETVVVSGQFLIDSESNVDTALSRMGGGSALDSEREAAGKTP
ncbi:MAG: efflux RND transporter periplasmic adaptor subunit [Pseudomonadota bacterium]